MIDQVLRVDMYFGEPHALRDEQREDAFEHPSAVAAKYLASLVRSPRAGSPASLCERANRAMN